MTKEELNNLLKLSQNDSKSISEPAETQIFECLNDIYNFSRMLYDNYRTSFDLNWLSNVGLAKKINIVNYDETFIYLDTLFYNRGSICGHQCVIIIEDVLKYSSQEFKDEFVKNAREKRIKQLDESIKNAECALNKYKEEKLKLENNG